MSDSQLAANIILGILAFILFIMSDDIYGNPRRHRKLLLISAGVFGFIPAFNLFLTAIIG